MRGSFFHPGTHHYDNLSTENYFLFSAIAACAAASLAIGTRNGEQET